MAATTSKTRRVEIRVTENEHELAEAAAAELGLSLSEFVRQAARASAQELFEERGRILVSDATADALLAALDEQASARSSLRELFARRSPFVDDHLARP